MSFDGWSRDWRVHFAMRWLPAWTGNNPQRLASFYTDDAFDSDLAIPNGIYGKEALIGYFTKLLARYPGWVWSQTRAQRLQVDS